MKKLTITLGLICLISATHAASFLDKVNFAGVAINRSIENTSLKHWEGAVGFRLGYDVSEKFGVYTEFSGTDTHGTLFESEIVAARISPYSFTIAKQAITPYINLGVGIRTPGHQIEEIAVGGVGLNIKLYKGLYTFIGVDVEKGVASSALMKTSTGLLVRF